MAFSRANEDAQTIIKHLHQGGTLIIVPLSMIGQTILHYQILEQLGAGGMGVVYRARDTRLDRTVALKFVLESASLDPDAKEHLLLEGKAAAKLDHPNVGVIHHVEEAEGRLFLVMGLYEGRSLKQRLDQQGPLELAEVLDIAVQTARGLAKAHHHDIIHRDIKPANLFLTEDGVVKILDFGLAKIMELGNLTQSGAMLGTPEYMSPEQVRGQAVDCRTDIWALGVVIYEMLTGVSPFKAEGGVATILQVLTIEPTPINEMCPDLPRDVQKVLDAALAKDLELRYDSTQQLLTDLQALKGGASLPSPPSSSVNKQATSPGFPGLAHVFATAPVTPPHNLTAPSAPLVGRRDELAVIRFYLQDPHCRILTLVGPGGTGKTRLALEAAYEQLEQEQYQDGIYFIALDSLASSGQVPSSIAEALELDLEGLEDPMTQVLRHLSEKQVLLVLDNFEHLMDGATLIANLVKSCTYLKILITSRTRLNLAEEWVLPVQGLLLPANTPATLEEAQSFDAIQLFVQRAKQTDVNFALTQENFPYINTISQLLQGFPLGIELAAGWVRMMSPAEIAQEIRENLDFLKNSSRNVSERHQSIRATFEYSWKLLTSEEQEVLRKLSVFRGGFRREAAKEIADAKLAVLASLIDKSLLHSPSNGRYDLHPLLNQYTQEKLNEHPEEQLETQDKHTNYFLRLLESCNNYAMRGHQREALRKVDSDLPNILEVAHRTLVRKQQSVFVKILKLLAVDGPYFTARGYDTQLLMLLEQAANTSREIGDKGAALNLLAQLGNALQNFVGDFTKAFEAYQEAYRLARHTGHASREAILLSNMGVVQARQGNNEDAQRYLKKAYELAKTQADDLCLAAILEHWGYVVATFGEWEQAQRLFQESLAVVDRLDQTQALQQPELDRRRFFGLINLGESERNLKHYEKALDACHAALSIAEACDNQVWIAHVAHNLGDIHHDLGQRSLAEQYFSQALELYRKHEVKAYVKQVTTFMKEHGYQIQGGKEYGTA